MVSFAARDARPRPEERVCRKSSADSNARARVSKDEDERLGFALMLRDASQRALAVEAPALASRCDAPQHEGEGRSTNLRLCEMMAGVASLFPACYLQGCNVSGGEGAMWHHPS